MNNGDTPAAAVPHQIIDANHVHFRIGSKGFTKREALASMAMQGMLANPEHMLSLEREGKTLSAHSVYMAEQLLKALEETK